MRVLRNVKDTIKIMVGRRIQLARVRARLSQRELADKVGRSQQLVTQWEHGKLLPGKEDMHKLRVIFGVSYDWFFSSDEITALRELSQEDGPDAGREIEEGLEQARREMQEGEATALLHRLSPSQLELAISLLKQFQTGEGH